MGSVEEGKTKGSAWTRYVAEEWVRRDLRVSNAVDVRLEGCTGEVQRQQTTCES
jgi:hypothetical protein